MKYIERQKWILCMINRNLSELDDLEFDLGNGKYSELADSLQHWSELFYNKTLDDAYGDCIAYLIYNMSKQMRKVDETSL